MKRQRIPDRVITNAIQRQEIIKVTEGKTKIIYNTNMKQRKHLRQTNKKVFSTMIATCHWWKVKLKIDS